MERAEMEVKTIIINMLHILKKVEENFNMIKRKVKLKNGKNRNFID